MAGMSSASPLLASSLTRYRPVGAAKEVLYYQGAECVMSGPAGTGKTRANLEKLFICASKYPGMRGLILRKTRESLTESALVTWETKVVPEGHECLAGPQRKLRQSYVFANGSEIVVGGIDKASKIMSTEYDMIYVQEAIELTEDDWESLTTRLRNGKMPYQQMIADTNPDKPLHWLKQRAGDGGPLKMIESRHEDNPVLWDMAASKWTAVGAEYINKLDNLTGPRKERLRYGRWVQADGIVYPEFDAAIHVIDRIIIPPSWPRLVIVDFGYTDPFVCQWYAVDGDSRLYRYREIYRTKVLVEDHAKTIARFNEVDKQAGAGRPRSYICDHDAEGRATLERHLRIVTTPALKDIESGVQEVKSRLKAAGDGKPRLFFLRDSLVEKDEDLADAAKPVSSVEEFDGFVIDPTATGKKGERPKPNQDDHGMDCIRYVCQALASKPIRKPGAGLGISFPEPGKRSILDELPADLFHMV